MKIKALHPAFLLTGLLIVLLVNCKKEIVTEDENLIPPSNGEVYDADGNKYATVVIGTQEWLASNLKTTKFKNGEAIPLWTNNDIWTSITSPGYCWYNHDATTYKNSYGALYNWFSAASGKLCPTGWHVPTYAEWTILRNYLGGDNEAGGKLKETGASHWSIANTGATNTTGFTAIPGGCRALNGIFTGNGSYGYWWSSTQDSWNFSWCQIMLYYDKSVFSVINSKQFGLSVRCLKD